MDIESWRARLLDESSSDSSDDDDDLIIEEFFPELLAQQNIVTKRGGSLPGRRANLPRDRMLGHTRLMNDYFCDDAVYNERLFRRRFRMRFNYSTLYSFCNSFHLLQLDDHYLRRLCQVCSNQNLNSCNLPMP